MTILMMLSSNKNGYYVFPLKYVSVSASAESKRLAHDTFPDSNKGNYVFYAIHDNEPK